MKALIGMVVVMGIVVLAVSFLVGCGERTSEIPVGEIMANATGGNIQEAAQNVEAAPVQVTETAVAPTVSAYVAPTAKEIQSALKNAGYYTGAIDGKIGPKSLKAIETFQQDHGLQVDGKVGPKTWGKLQQYLNKTAEPVAITTQAIAD